MHKKKKKVKTVIIEKYKYDNDNNHNHDDDDYGIELAPELLLKLLEFAYSEATSDEQLHAIVTRAHMLSRHRDRHDDDECLYMDDYTMIITEPVVPTPVETTPVVTEPTV